MTFPRPLPRKWRLFNRAALLVLALAGIIQCGRCALRDSDGENFAEHFAETPKESLPERELSDSASAPFLGNAVREINLEHVYAQRDTGLAHLMDTFLRRYRPQDALYLAVDPRTNEIVAWGERKENAVQTEPDYLSRATFPAASLSKTVTIAAAFDSKRYATHSEIPMIGRAHTLYRQQLKIPENYRGPVVPVHEAFAKSYNPPIALVGMNVGAKRLKDAAGKLGFNRNFPGNVPERSAYSPPDSGYALAEVASGFTQDVTLSPLQAAGIVRAILQKKPFEIPWERNGATGYAPKNPVKLDGEKFSENAYRGLRLSMISTATVGTARKQMSTRNISRKFFADLDIGGKTGSLDGESPKGRYDWFMGFAQSKANPDKAIVIVVMQVHGQMRTQTSTQIASLLINYWAKEK